MNLKKFKNPEHSPLVRTVFNDSPISMQIVSSSGKIVFGNKAWQKLWNLDDSAAILVMESYNFFEDKIVLAENIDVAFRKALAGEVQTLPTLNYDPGKVSLPGRPRWLDISFHPIVKESGDIEEVVCLQVDATLRQEAILQKERLFEELQQAIVLRDQFISMASHELKTPLTSIKLQMKIFEVILASSEVSAKDLQVLAATAKSSDAQVDRMAKLVDEMLDISRIEEGKLTIRHENFHLTKVIEDVSNRFLQMLESQNIPLTLQLRPDVFVYGDSFRTEQVLINLLMNAIKYGKKTPIKIELVTLNNFARFSVNDQGPGIDSKDHERIFRRFERANDSYHGDGLGLGLFLCQEIIKAQGGSITLESELGAGATFSVDLPLAET